jgi:hypothetical protein
MAAAAIEQAATTAMALRNGVSKGFIDTDPAG